MKFYLGVLLFLPLFTHGNTLIDIQKLEPSIRVDLKYATPDNFCGRAVYPPEARCYLESAPAHALKVVQSELKKQKLSLKIWDGYRPLSVQKIFWGLVPNPLYVADPAQGSRHNSGMAVDLTIVREDGTELDMGTPFDEFSERAHRDYANLTPEQKANRTLLDSLMTKNGFQGMPSEWWHFDFKGWENRQLYPILDVPFEQLAQS